MLERDVCGVRDLGQEFGELVVEAEALRLLVDELEQHGADVGEGQGSVAEVHVCGDGDAGHGFSGGFEVEGFAAAFDLNDDALQVVLLDCLVDDSLDGFDLRGAGFGGDGVGGQGGERSQDESQGQAQKGHG